MDFAVLGSLAARRDGADVVLGSYKRRSLLALLLIHANEVVATDRIIDELWGDEPAGDRQNSLWVHVSQLRSALEPDREKRSEGTVLLTRPPGYLLRAGPDELDAWRFERSVQEGRALLDTDPGAASIVLGEGLALWRGRPYEDVGYERFAQPEIGRLEEVRLEAVGLRIDADLRRGLGAELVGELESLVRQHPLREGFTGQQMVALHRSGRRADALRAFHHLKARLGEELGVEPSTALQRLETQIVVGDHALAHQGGGPGRQTRLAVRGYEIREEIGTSGLGAAYRAYQPAVGREVSITIIPSEQADDPRFIRRFEAEAELVARLEHPHIVPLYDYWREPGAAYLVTRLLRGGTLTDALNAGPFPARRAAQLVGEIGSALSLAHRRGTVHRAVEPANILIDDGSAYLGNFAIAAEDERGAATYTVPIEPPYASPEQLAGAPVTPASDIYSLAMVLAHALLGRAPDDVHHAAAELPGPLADVVRKATSLEAHDRHHDIDAFVLAVQAAFAQSAEPGELAEGVTQASDAAVNPYKGLRSFEEPDADDFFGRERLVERLIARLGADGSSGRFVALVGPSGSGKSSAVKAGLLPALRLGAVPGSDRWFAVGITPGRHPYEELEAALLRVAVNPPASLLEQLTAGAAGIRRAVRDVLPERGQLLLVIDQFEELFTQSAPATTQAFLDALAAGVDDPHGGLRVVVTLRADFYDRPLGHRAIGELVRRGTEVITPMSVEELERAIDGPAEQLGVRFEPALVAEMLAEVSDRPGGLPLLQYALTELFDQRRGPVIELATYRAMGGVSGALVRRAEALHAGFDDRARAASRQALLRLVTLGEGTDDVRRRVLRQELIALGDPAVEVVLDTYGRHRLLSFDRDPITRGPTVEIAHEALLTAWDRLRDWIDDAREDLHHERRLANAAAEWQLADRDPTFLLRGPRLEQLAGWAADTDLSLHPVEREFLEASVAQRAADVAAEQQRRLREDRLRRKTRVRTRQLVGVAVALAVLAAVTAFAVDQRNEADRLGREQAVTAEAQRLAAASSLLASSLLAERDAELAVLLALQSLDTSARADMPAVVQAEEALHWGIQAAGIPYPDTDAPVEVRDGPGGLTGIYRLPLVDLVDLARTRLPRSFTADECARYAIAPCPDVGAAPRWPLVPDEPVRPALPAQGDRPLAGTRVTFVGGVDRGAGLGDELARFEQQTGIEIVYQNNPHGLLEVEAGLTIADPDVSMNFTTGTIVHLAEMGRLVDLSASVDPRDARRLVGDYLVDLVSTDAGYFAAPLNLDLKGLVWYPSPEFEEAGYAAPRSWDELVALSEQMVADGRTPWCIGLQSGGAPDGWPATDWVEALVLRLGGVERYDEWARGQIPFDDPLIREAVAMFGQVAFGEGFVHGGSDSISQNYFDQSGGLLTDPPECWLHHQGTFHGEGAGVDVDYFVMPPIDPGGDTPLFGTAAGMSALRDRPEVRELIRWVLSPEWGAAWAAHPGGTFMPANVEFDPRRCRADGVDERGNDFRERLCRDARDALAAGRWRVDASDSMLPEIGGVAEDGTRGPFLQAMIDYVDRGPDNLDEVLATIEAARR